ncbi:hypothetical protein K438DRAFT_2079376 [Mycena galopus ATCC 62051]|nr:hypothetical protein K438DRAFT_2079376 [Mycena galopus ATCC 62051]
MPQRQLTPHRDILSFDREEAGTITGEASQLKNFATYTVFCTHKPKMRRCPFRRSTPLHPERRLALLQGLQALEATIFPQLARQDKIQIAIEMGTTAQHAWMATAGLLGERPVAEPTAIAANPKGKAKATAPTATKPKAKTKDAPQEPAPLKVEYDRWSKLVYATDGMPTRMITLIFYERANATPTFGSAFLRFLGCFYLCDLGIAQRVHAVNGRRSVPYERYSVFERAFIPTDPNEPINMSDRGSYLLYKAASLREGECPKIADWKATAQASAALALDSDDSDEEGDFHSDSNLEIVAESYFTSSQNPLSSATPGSSRTKSVIRNSAIASSSKFPSSSATTASSSTLVKRTYSRAFEGGSSREPPSSPSTRAQGGKYKYKRIKNRTDPSKTLKQEKLGEADQESEQKTTDPSKTLKQLKPCWRIRQDKSSMPSQSPSKPASRKKRKSSGAPKSLRQKVNLAAEAKERRIRRDELRTRRAEMACAWDAAGLVCFMMSLLITIYIANCDQHDEPEMKAYFALDKAYEIDFGSPYSDDLYLRQMGFRALVEENLGRLFNHDPIAIAAEISKPSLVTIRNPYVEGDSRQLVAEAKLREWKLTLEGPRAVEALPQTINMEFPFIVKCQNPNDLKEYSDALFNLHLLKDEVLRL